MSERKIVFVQCEGEDEAELVRCLDQFAADTPYLFFVTTKDFTLSRQEVLAMLEELTSRVSAKE